MSRPQGLALPADWSMLPREQRLKLWLRGQGLTLTTLAARLGVHKSTSGKWLVRCNEELPQTRRLQLLAMGMPEEYLP
ncbi:MAG: XRE family transcriptional regulator [Solidesulfovibrio sp.]|uniref:XRE family transcriptional regulator n=1 Tax=Solidesulfovibrio sp. TaxID=2910990 RepID=UPI002B1F810B|nr:XRE family transcriptional regulator [Solidesulfovibrio sp.]